jgi:RimJ/RimL family protein N-acetyltransferase
MADLGGPISLDESKAKLSKYIAMYEHFGFSRYFVEDAAGRFIGYVGICPRVDDTPIGKHNEIGWRLNVCHWGNGYATEAAQACMSEFHRVFPATEIISYTSALNKRSQNVMIRLNMARTPSRDFQWHEPNGTSIPMLVWVTS